MGERTPSQLAEEYAAYLDRLVELLEQLDTIQREIGSIRSAANEREAELGKQVNAYERRKVFLVGTRVVCVEFNRGVWVDYIDGSDENDRVRQLLKNANETVGEIDESADG